MKTNEMTPRERVITALRNGQPDRVPVVPVYVGGAIRRAGYKYAECMLDADKYVAAVLKCHKDFGFDGFVDLGLPALVAESLGANLRVHEDDPPTPGEPILKTHGDLQKLEPRNFLVEGRIPQVLSIISKMRRALGSDVAVIAIGALPFRVATCFRGLDQSYRDMYRNPDLIKEVAEFCLEPCLEYAVATVEAGADMLMIPDPISSKGLMSRKHYAEFSYPFSKRVYEALNARGIPYWVHTCGDWSDRFDLAADGPTGLLLAAEADIAEVKAAYGSKVSLAGNVKSVDVMLLGTPEDVEREARECIEKGAPGGGFILSADCTIPPDTPEANLLALVDAAKKFGKSVAKVL